MSVCGLCGGERWVCEMHGAPWDGSDSDCCAGAGMPCPECNAGMPPEFPPGSVEVERFQ